MQVHHGGYFIDTICKKRDTDRLKHFQGDAVANPKESVLMCYKQDKGARKHVDMLNEMITKGDNTKNPLGVFDLGVKIELEKKETLKTACTDMSASFNDQKVATVGFACFEQHDGHDERLHQAR